MSESHWSKVCTRCNGEGGRDSIFGNWKSCSICDGSGSESGTTQNEDDGYDHWDPDHGL